MALGGALMLGLGPPAVAGSSAPAAQVNAEGNIFTDPIVPGGTLRFDPADVSVHVGDIVRWKNTDVLVPHTATEDHGLWDETGTYGATPANPPGFGPGETRQRAFDGGTFHYYCQVHPTQMHGVVRVPDTVEPVQREGATRLRVTWGASQLPDGQVFDVQRRRSDAWRTVRDGTTKLHGTFRGTRGEFRSRVRRVDVQGAASDWSRPSGT